MHTSADPEDEEDEDLDLEPDNPDDWREYAEDHETGMAELMVSEEWPDV